MPPRWAEDFIAGHGLPTGYGGTISTVYDPLAAAIEQRSTGQSRPLVVGLNGPQGSGKSTGAEVLGKLLYDRGLSAAVLSIDDLYLSHAERQRLAREVHPLLAMRGPPGTHDPGLGLTLIGQLGRLGRVALPRFDKASDDRRPRSAWQDVEAPLDVLVFEGWCVGAAPQPAAPSIGR
jgi:D-glycerate 3-kinase